jgi:hypothetical protein
MIPGGHHNEKNYNGQLKKKKPVRVSIFLPACFSLKCPHLAHDLLHFGSIPPNALEKVVEVFMCRIKP